MFALARKRKREGKGAADAGPSGVLTSFHRGMGQLIETLADALDADSRAELRLGAAVSRIDRDDAGWVVGGPEFRAGPFAAVVNAAPAHAAGVQLRETSAILHEHLVRIPFAPVAVVALGFPRAAVKHDLQGFGLLIPSRERRELLGALWTSSIFPGRAPEGKVLLRCMAGGADNPGVLDLDDEALTNLTLAELRPLLGIKGHPDMVRIIRHRRAIAQYVPGHLARLAAVERELANHPGLFLTGSSYKGISVNSCVKDSESVADTVLAHLTGQAGRTAREAV
jgi:oxygen-dependent protoporphyrinogen oxidase